MLGFIIRNRRNFVIINIIITLFNALVRSHSEYAAVIWPPQAATHCDTIIQKRFIRYLYIEKNIYSHLVSYRTILKDFNIQTVEIRRQISSMLFIYYLVNNHKYANHFLIQNINVIKISLEYKIRKPFVKVSQLVHLQII